MADYYEGENSCVRCLRSSPIASLLGFIIVLIGGGAFGGATIFARRYLLTISNASHLLPYLDYVVYGLVGAIGLTSLLAYLLCALSSGWNAKHCFESSRKSTCGRCCNMTLIICLVFGLLLWTAIGCMMSYPVMSIAFLLHRNEGPARLRLATIDTRLPIQRLARSIRQDDIIGQLDLPNSDYQGMYQPQSEQHPDPISDNLPPGDTNLKDVPQLVSQDVSTKQANGETHPSGGRALDNQVPSIIPETSRMGQKIHGQVMSAAESAKAFFNCNADMFDLSYYGLYDDTGHPLLIARENFDQTVKDLFICVCIAVAGIFLLILGYIQIVVCTAMNFARMQERRYYEASDAGEEGEALQ